jgi:ABC-type transporter Mla subunit MlaD
VPKRSLALFANVLALACFGPALEIHVSFVGPVEIEEGSPVIYQGVEIGRVSAISLSQESPQRPANVTLTLAITSSDVRLREGDRFEISSAGLLRDNVVRVTPAPEESPPLANGATVAGVPPVVTRLTESLGSAVDAVSEAASEKARRALEVIAESIDSIEIEPHAEPEGADP